jgi:hypothetical protein
VEIRSGGDLDIALQAGVLARGRPQPTNNNNDGGGEPPANGGGDGDYNCAFSNANACFKGGKRWNPCLPGIVQIRRPIEDEWHILSGDGVQAPTDAEKEYAKARMLKAHNDFFEHWDSRPNYGKVMLMTDPYQTKIVEGEVVTEVIDLSATDETNTTRGNRTGKVTNADNKTIHAAVKDLPLERRDEVAQYIADNSGQGKDRNKFKEGQQQFERIFYQTVLIDDPNRERVLIALARWWKRQCETNGYKPWDREWIKEQKDAKGKTFGGQDPYTPAEDFKPRAIDMRGLKGSKDFEGHPLRNSFNHETPLPPQPPPPPPPPGAKKAPKGKAKPPKELKADRLQIANLAQEIVAVHNAYELKATEKLQKQSKKEDASSLATWLDALVYVFTQILQISLDDPPEQDKPEPEITTAILKTRKPPPPPPPAPN